MKESQDLTPIAQIPQIIILFFVLVWEILGQSGQDPGLLSYPGIIPGKS